MKHSIPDSVLDFPFSGLIMFVLGFLLWLGCAYMAIVSDWPPFWLPMKIPMALIQGFSGSFIGIIFGIFLMGGGIVFVGTYGVIKGWKILFEWYKSTQSVQP
jgi:hypothetical protein